MTFAVSGMHFNDRSAAVMALVDDFVCACGAGDIGAITRLFTDPEATADRILSEWQTNIAADGQTSAPVTREEIRAALESIRAELG